LRREQTARGIQGSTQLMRAAWRGEDARVRELLAAGAALNSVDGSLHYSALLWACRQGQESTAALLLEAYEAAGAPEALNAEVWGETPLAVASKCGRDKVVRLLLARGADQTRQDADDGSTALHWATGSHNSSRADTVVFLLLAAPGADAAIAMRDSEGVSPLARASSSGRAAAVAALLGHSAASRAMLNEPDSRGQTPLMLAVSARTPSHFDTVRLLLERGAKLEQQDKSGRTAMHVAAVLGNDQLLEAMCTAPGARAVLALQDNEGLTPLALALRHDSSNELHDINDNPLGRARCAAVLRAHGVTE
jgi:ankyrin repeat protein